MMDFGIVRVPKTGPNTRPNIGQGACDAMPCLVASVGINTLDIVHRSSSIVHRCAPDFKRSSDEMHLRNAACS